MSMSQVAAVGKIHSQNLIAILNCGQVNSHVGLSTAMGLHVRMVGAEQLFGAVNSCLFDHVSPFAATVIALGGIPFGVLVSKDRSSSFKHSLANEVLRCDQLKSTRLPRYFIIDCVSDDRIDLCQRRVSEIVHCVSSVPRRMFDGESEIRWYIRAQQAAIYSAA